MSFAENLKQLLQETSMTQAQLSAMTGIGRSSISQYLSGKNEPTFARRKYIAQCLGVPDDYFERFAPVADSGKSDINLPVVLAARLMGKSTRWIQQGLRDGVFPWGYAVKLKDWSYFISIPKFEEYTGIKVPVNRERGVGA